MDFEIAYTSREITPWGGMVLLRQMLDKLGFRDGICSLPICPHPAPMPVMIRLLFWKPLLPVSGAVLIGSCIRRLPAMIRLLRAYSAGSAPRARIPTSASL